MNTENNYFVHIDTKGIANIFAFDFFDENGYLLDEFEEHTKFHINDFENKKWFSTLREACKYAELINNK